MKLLWIAVAFLLDWLLGDPYSWPHPVKVIGNYISFFQKQWLTDKLSEKKKFYLGIILWFSTVILTIVTTYGLLKITSKIHPLLGIITYIYLSYTTLATKSLALEGKKVYDKLAHGTLTEARAQVAMIVGRDTSELTKAEITNATIETIAENASDGVIAPLLCLMIGGPVLALTYKAVNTLDSMVGYVTPKYRAIGCFSAKMDDLWNLIPARVTWFLLLLASGLLGMNLRNAFKVGCRDCRKHKSPNSGFPESVAAGALEIQLGGTHIYHGVEIYKPHIGSPLKEVAITDILKMNRLLYMTAFLGLISFSGIWLLLQQIILK
ncbi:MULTISPECIES: adenosylcobinamide-phosphate synthase CbiB [unclassified Enterococcus]|uniref:adenosylcobinamide-phosphate synthase CbiB n=1 Tax=unclassified Enterococcus TaxID=2608891 RepID=UPI0024766308|nr:MULTISPECIES: adenosylcobinamide-phosphate synthase CbiB [unclassified Enterococcus]